MKGKLGLDLANKRNFTDRVECISRGPVKPVPNLDSPTQEVPDFMCYVLSQHILICMGRMYQKASPWCVTWLQNWWACRMQCYLLQYVLLCHNSFLGYLWIWSEVLCDEPWWLAITTTFFHSLWMALTTPEFICLMGPLHIPNVSAALFNYRTLDTDHLKLSREKGAVWTGWSVSFLYTV